MQNTNHCQRPINVKERKTKIKHCLAKAENGPNQCIVSPKRCVMCGAFTALRFNCWVFNDDLEVDVKENHLGLTRRGASIHKASGLLGDLLGLYYFWSSICFSINTIRFSIFGDDGDSNDWSGFKRLTWVWERKIHGSCDLAF